MSSKRCCVPQCAEIEDPQRVLHWFPSPEKDVARFRTWVHAIGGEILSLSNENIYKLRRVCHAHFEEKYCCRRNRISNIAIPTLLMPGPLSISKFTHNDKIPFREVENLPSTSEGSNMAPLLYKDEASPPACAVRMVADIIGLQLAFKDLDISQREHKSSGYLQLNSLGTIPVLVDDDFVLSGSHAIMIYLISKYGGDKGESLYPSDMRTRAIVNQVLFFDAGILFTRIVALPTIMESLQAPTEKHLHELEEGYGMIEAYLSRNEYIAAEHLTIADLSVATTLAAVEAIQPLNKEKFPLTAKWQTLIQELPFFKNIATPAIAKFNVTMQHYWKKDNKQ